VTAEVRSPGSAPGSAPGPTSGGSPLLAPHQAAVLLDQVIYEQVLECVDLDALYRLEQSLTMLVTDFEGDGDRAADLVTAMLDRALVRIPDDVRHYLHAISGPLFEGCDLCKDEDGDADEEAAPPGRPRKRPPGARFRS
jgi:hypothetical protein